MNLPLKFLLLIWAGWVNRTQQDVIDYLKEENPYGQESRPNRKSLLCWELGHSPNADFALELGGQFSAALRLSSRREHLVNHELRADALAAPASHPGRLDQQTPARGDRVSVDLGTGGGMAQQHLPEEAPRSSSTAATTIKS